MTMGSVAGYILLTWRETGVLIFISIFEHKVWVLGDRGINSKVTPDQWGAIVTALVAGMKEKRAAEALCTAVSGVGDILKEHFPVRPDDVDELSNLIIDA